MRAGSSNRQLDALITSLNGLWKDKQDRFLLTSTIRWLDTRYMLSKKIANEPGVQEILKQMIGRLADAFGKLSNIQGKKILDIACGSNTSKAPASLDIDTPFGRRVIKHANIGYTAQFEPWFCRILFELGAEAVGIDFGDLDRELFTHYRVDLGQMGALNFLPDHSFDAIQDSRLFGSPEFTAQFPSPADRLKVAEEIRRQERRLLKANGIVIHSDADALLKRENAS